MRKTILATVAVLAIGGGTAGVLIAQAQPAPPSAAPGGPTPPARQWMGWTHRMQEGRDGHEGRWAEMRRNFALVYRHDDRQLTAPDVQKIAEAFLLWQGNHTWKVANVKSVSDDAIAFDLTTPNGDVVASFTMNPHSGRLTRTG